MITNIIDNRNNPFKFLEINAIVEATWHSNKVEGSDKSPEELGGPSCCEREHLTLAAAIDWANSFPEPVTLYLYDEGQVPSVG